MPRLEWSTVASEQYLALESNSGLEKRFRAVRAALGKMERNLRHPGLNTHVFDPEGCPHGKKLFEAYAENATASAYRIFWCYQPPPPPDTILIVAITPHP